MKKKIRILPVLMLLIALSIPNINLPAQVSTQELKIEENKGLLVIKGVNFGEKNNGDSLQFILEAHTKQEIKKVKLKIVKWTPKEVYAQIPKLIEDKDVNAYIILKTNKNKQIARSSKPFRLNKPFAEANSPVAKREKSMPSDSKKEKPGQKPQNPVKDNSPDVTEAPGDKAFNKQQPAITQEGRENLKPSPLDRRKNKQASALVLEGGGAFGAFQVGVIENLYERGLQPAIITGTSVGALNGAKLAEGYPGVYHDLVNLWMNISGNNSIYINNPAADDSSIKEDLQEDVFYFIKDISITVAKNNPFVTSLINTRYSSRDLNSVHFHLSKLSAIGSVYLQQPLVDLVENNLDVQKILKSGIKLRLAAITREGGKLRFFTEAGDIESADGARILKGRQSAPIVNRDRELKDPTVADGVLASSAIPILFGPWLIKGGEYYWDGAVRESAPVRKALQLGATDLIIVKTGPREQRLYSESPVLELTINQVKCLDCADYRGELFVKVKSGQSDWIETPHKENDKSFRPYWKFYPINGQIRIAVWDKSENYAGVESPISGRRDINPQSGEEEITINVNPQNGTIDGDVSGWVGDEIVVKGDAKGKKVQLRFRITVGNNSESTLGVNSALLQATGGLINHSHEEVGVEDLSILKELDLLHEIASSSGDQTVLNSVKSFPLPRDLSNKPFMIPDYVVIEPPVILGEIIEFDPEIIRANYEIGKIVARYTKIEVLDNLPVIYGVEPHPPYRQMPIHVTQSPEAANEGWLEQNKRSDILAFLNKKIRDWRNREDARENTDAKAYRMLYEEAINQLRNTQILPTLRSRRGNK